MIFIKKTVLFTKELGIFSLIEILIVFICSLLNLIFLSNSLTTIIILLANCLSFFILSYLYGKKSKQKGIVSGLLNGIILSLFLIIIYSIFYSFSFNINKILYYLILILSSTTGGIIGKNTQNNIRK